MDSLIEGEPLVFGGQLGAEEPSEDGGEDWVGHYLRALVLMHTCAEGGRERGGAGERVSERENGKMNGKDRGRGIVKIAVA